MQLEGMGAGLGAGLQVGWPALGQGLGPLEVGPRLGPALGLGPRLGPLLGLGPRQGPLLGLGPRLGPLLGLGPRLGPPLGLGPVVGPPLGLGPLLGSHRRAVHRLLVGPPAPLALTHLYLRVGEGLQGRRAAPRSPRRR